MVQEPLLRILNALTAVGSDSLDERVCLAMADLLAVAGVALAVAAQGTGLEPLCASDRTAAALDELQGTVGQGPSVDAHDTGEPVGEPDLADPRTDRWIAFAGAAQALGAAALFAFPLRVGAARVGVLTLYHRSPGRLGSGQYVDALITADVATQAILTVQADARPGALARALEGVSEDRAEIHQATGIVAAQLGLGVTEALVVLRARAYAADRPLPDVAADVVAHRRRIE